jgi:hypothetical protein
MRRLQTLWKDDCGGALLSSELLFLFSTLVLGTLSGLVAMRQALLSELVESGRAIMSLNQSFSMSGQSGAEAFTGGSATSDTTNTISISSVAPSNAFINPAPLD